MEYLGKYISGNGDIVKLELLDKSFSMLHSSPVLPNLKMVYKSKIDMFSEGFIWGANWWIQNSYGFTLGAIPLLAPHWAQILQRSYDAFWNRIGDGKRIGADGVDKCNQDNVPNVLSFCAPDGSLGDTVFENGIVYRQGDGDMDAYDWFYEGTAAGVNMQADILLFDRRKDQLEKYIPLMWRSLNFIERTRTENGLFLVGAASNLLAPSYGGSYNEQTGEIGKGYLTGLAVTYAAALKKFIELLKMTGDTEGCAECQKRLDRTLQALPLVLTDEGYLAKSMDPDGTLHGVYGAKKYGYLEAVCNVDAIAGSVVSDTVANSIYRKIAAVEGIRPVGAICTNYPHLDDTLISYQTGNRGPNSLELAPKLLSGDWVDGACWATVEGRAILAYLHLDQYEDAFKAADCYMKWAEEYRQDAPLTQWGYNTNNWWAKENDDYTVCERPVAVMIDNFAPVTCLLRGIFEYTANAKGLLITPHIPDSITEYVQHEPIWFAGCKIYISYKGGNCTPVFKLDGKVIATDNRNVFLEQSMLPADKEVYLSIDCSGQEGSLPFHKNELHLSGDISGVPKDIAEIYTTCLDALANEEDELRSSMLYEILLSVEAAAERRRLPFDKCSLRPMNDERKNGIIELYDMTVHELYQSYCNAKCITAR